MKTDCIIIGAGHSGLAMSHYLSRKGIDHVNLERGETANSWKKERWDSLRLLTPNWQASLPGYAYSANDPDGFLTMPETIRFIEDYAHHISAPVRENTTVVAARHGNPGFTVETGQGNYSGKTLVIASGACNQVNIPAFASAVPSSISVITPMEYQNPDQLEKGGVLVVGASATGIQLADEIHESGRQVIVAVGEHVRLPRVYRGKDIQWWMQQVGVLDDRFDEVDNLVRARNVPSPQLVGTPERKTLDLNTLTLKGALLRGRLAGINEGKLQFSGSLKNNCALADLKMNRLLNTIDEWATDNGMDDLVDQVHRFEPTRVEDSPPLIMNLKNGQIRTILWCTGYRPDYSWLEMPVFDRKGYLRHSGGVSDIPGMYLMGLTFLRRRKSSFIHGAEDDARDLSAHLASFLNSGDTRA